MPPKSALSASFQTFADAECRGSSPLYERLALEVAADPELLDLASHGRTPVPNLFLAAVHYLLLREPRHPLASWYAGVAHQPVPAADPFPLFRDFCLERRAQMLQLLSNRLVQTNEVRRCGYLLPAFHLVSRLAPGRPLALIEIGASAGLNLCFDRYGYDYGDGRLYGDASSPVQLKVELRSAVRPALPTEALDVRSRTGIDLHPINAEDEAEVDWLRALIWPEHAERRVLMERALEVVRRTELTLIAGDGAAVVGEAIAAVESDAVPCIFQTHTLNQFPQEALDRFFAALVDAGGKRELYFVSRQGDLTLTCYRPSGQEQWALAKCDAHGRWVVWLATS